MRKSGQYVRTAAHLEILKENGRKTGPKCLQHLQESKKEHRAVSEGWSVDRLKAEGLDKLSVDHREGVIYQVLWTRQGGNCALCKRTLAGNHPHLDHDHEKMVYRGLLCRRCNNGLGFFKDSVLLLIAAATYLQKPIDEALKVFTNPSRKYPKRRVRR